MDWNLAAGDWEHFKGTVKARWINLTEEHLRRIAGRRVELAGHIQEAYGITKLQAELEIRSFEARHRQTAGKSRV